MLAIFFAVWAMRGATATDITLNDQARHALNGVALLDIVREGGLSRPVAWLRDYFVHFPALSMPYHPPLFPAVEALFYAAFGVNPVSARLAVAGFVAGAVLLFFRQVRSLEENSYVAAASVLIFFSLADDADAERRCDAGASRAVLGTCFDGLHCARKNRVACT